MTSSTKGEEREIPIYLHVSFIYISSKLYKFEFKKALIRGSYCTARQSSPLRRKFMECSINSPALSLLTKHLVFGQRLKTHNFSAFYWSPRGSLVSIGQHFVATRVVYSPKSTETSLITESDQYGPEYTGYCSYARPAQPGPTRTRLCGPCIAVIVGFNLLTKRDR